MSLELTVAFFHLSVQFPCVICVSNWLATKRATKGGKGCTSCGENNNKSKTMVAGNCLTFWKTKVDRWMRNSEQASSLRPRTRSQSFHALAHRQSSNAINSVHANMHAYFDKRDEMSSDPARCEKYGRTIRFMTCPPNFTPQGSINSNFNPKPKKIPNTNTNPKVSNRWFALTVERTLSDVHKSWASI